MTVDPQLDTLEAKGLIRLATYQPDLEYLFRHALVQDAAYGSLLKQERRALHRLVGESLESLYPERSAELAGILAMHFEQAGDNKRALRYLVADGHYALERNALHEAFAAFDRARALLPPATDGEDPAVQRTRVEIELGRARAGWSYRAWEESVAELRRILPIAEGLGDLELIAQVHLFLALIQLETGRKATEPEVQRSLDRIAEIGRALDDPSLGALPLALVGLNKVFVGPIREGVEALEKAIPLMERRRDFIGAAFSRGWLAIGYASLGEFEKAEEASRNASAEAARGDVIAQVDAQIVEATLRAERGQLDEALPIAKACVKLSEESGATACTVVGAWVLGDVYQQQGNYVEAQKALKLSLDLSQVTGAGTIWRPTVTAWLGYNAAALGDDTTEVEWQAAIDEARALGNMVGAAGIQWKRAQTLARRGEWQAAIDDYAAVAETWQREGARPRLARVLRDWGVALRHGGKPEEGDDRLRRALALFDELTLDREAAAVRQLLQA
jgi:tetratricopeptide (TPR) repeat protein